MSLYISNAFAIQMVSGETKVSIRPLTITEAKDIVSEADFVSAVVYSNIAAIISNDLGIDVSPNKNDISLTLGDRLLVAAYIRPRFPDGTTQLPGESKIEYRLVEVIE